MSIKNKIIDVASDIMSAPARMKAKSAMDKANKFVANRKYVRERKGMPDSGMESDMNGKPDELFRARMTDRAMTSDYENEYAKRMNPKFPRR